MVLRHLGKTVFGLLLLCGTTWTSGVGSPLDEIFDGRKQMGLARLSDSSPTNVNVLSLEVQASQNQIVEGNTNVQVVVTRAGDLMTRVSVDYATSDRGAKAGEDYGAVAGTFTFEPGESRKSFSIPIFDDEIPEANETFAVSLTNPSAGARLEENATQEITIIDDDNFYFQQDEYVVSESVGYVDLRFFPGQHETLYLIGYEPVDGTAKAGRDYLFRTGVLDVCYCWQFHHTEHFPIFILDNAVTDGNRSFRVTLRNLSSGLQLGPRASTIITIVDDDTAAGPRKGFNGTIQTSAVQPDGRILVGGWFTAIDGLSRYYIARIFPDGSNDLSFNSSTNINGPVLALALQADGKILIGGRFTAVGNTARPRVARLNGDGSLDATFDPGMDWAFPPGDAYVAPEVHAILVQGDGKILVGGSMTSIGNIERRGITRLNPDGALDPSFRPGLGFFSGVKSLALQNDGKILAGSAPGNNVYGEGGLQRLNSDGSRDTNFTSFGYAAVPTILVQTDGKILFFHEGLGRLNPDGSIDTTFHSDSFAYWSVYSTAQQQDGKLLLAGTISGYGFMRLNADGTKDSFFKPVTQFAPYGRTMAILGDGSIFLGGSFSNYDFESLDDLYRKKYFLGGLYLRTFPASFYFQRLKPDGELVTDLRFDRIVHLPNGETHLSLAGQALNGFSLESSTNLHDWSQVATNAMPNSGLVFRDASSTNASQRFYRVR